MISSDQIAKNYDIAGVRKANLPGLHMLLLGFFAGMFIALAGAAASVASADITNPSLHRIPRKKTSEKLRETFVTAVFTMFCASSPSYSPGICPYTNRTDTNREPIRLPR